MQRACASQESLRITESLRTAATSLAPMGKALLKDPQGRMGRGQGEEGMLGGL